jgi:hypothetical protein
MRYARRSRSRGSTAVAAGVLAVLTTLLVTDTISSSAAPPAAAPAPQAEVASAPTTQPSPTAEVPTLQRGLAQAAVDAAQAAAGPGIELAVAVLDRGTGEIAVGARGNEPYYTASLSKVVVAVDVLDRRRLEGLTVTDDDVALFRRALGASDDSAMSALWERFDGAGAAGRVAQRLGLSATSAPSRVGQWGEMQVPAADTVRIWGYILDSLPAADRDLLISAMDAAPPIAKDGFDQAFGLLSPAVRGPDGPGAVAKQGWMCCFSGKYYLHSAGAVGADRRFVVALLTREPRTRGWATARTEVTGIATAAIAALDA